MVMWAKKTHVIISIDTGKAFDNIQNSFVIKTLNKVGTDMNFFNTIKAKYEKPTGNIILNDERLLLLKSGTKQEHPLLPSLFNITMDFLARVIR